MMARRGIPFIPKLTLPNINGRRVTKNESVNQFLSTPTVTFSSSAVIPSKPTCGKLLVIDANHQVWYDKMEAPACLFTSELTLNVKKGIAVDWLKRMSEMCFPYMKRLRIKSE